MVFVAFVVVAVAVFAVAAANGSAWQVRKWQSSNQCLSAADNRFIPNTMLQAAGLRAKSCKAKKGKEFIPLHQRGLLLASRR